MLENKIIQIFIRSGLSRQDFASKLNISNSVLSHITSGRNKASLDLVIGILKLFPDINPDWLILDTGEMLRDESSDHKDNVKKQIMTSIDILKKNQDKNLQEIVKLESLIVELK